MYRPPYLKIIALIGGLLISIKILAQQDLTICINAFLITNINDTLSAKIQYNNDYQLQYVVITCDTAGKPLIYYSPNDLKGFYIPLNSDTLQFLSLENPNAQGRVFLKRLYKGRMDLFQFTQIDRRKSALMYQAQYYLWKNDWLKPFITSDTETEALLQLFSSCFELQYKIKSHQYGISQIGQIIEEFEMCDRSNSYDFSGE